MTGRKPRTKRLSYLQRKLLEALSTKRYRAPPLRTYASTILSLVDRGYIKLGAPLAYAATYSRYLMIVTPDGAQALKRAKATARKELP